MMRKKGVPVNGKGQIRVEGMNEIAEDLQQVKEAASEVPKIVQGLNTLTTAHEKLATAAQKSATAQAEAAQAQAKTAQEGKLKERVKAMGELATKVGEVGSKMRQAAKEISASDPDLSQTIDAAGKATEAIGRVASTAMAGFAAGGPIGAVAGGAVEAMGLVTSHMAEVEREMQKNIAAGDAAIKKAYGTFEKIGTLKSEAENKKWWNTLNKETEALRRQNDQLQINQKILEARASGEDMVANEKSSMQRAAIEADESLSEEHKIEALAMLDDEDANRSLAAQKRGIEQNREAAYQEAQKTHEEGNLLRSKYTELEKEISRLESWVKAAEKQGGNGTDRAAYAEASRALALKKEDLKNLEKQKQEAWSRSMQASAHYQGTSAIADEQLKALDKAAEHQKTTRDIRTQSLLKEQWANSNENLASAFHDAGNENLPKGLRNQMQQFAKMLEDGSDAGEIAEISKRLEEVAKGAGTATIEALQVMLRSQQDQAKEIESLKMQIMKQR